MNSLDYIQNLDLSRLVKKSTDSIENGGYGWDLETAIVAENRYKKWLYLVSKYGVSSVEIEILQDLFWHLHILDTKNYQKDCENIFGFFLHHNPFPKNISEPKIKWENIL